MGLTIKQLSERLLKFIGGDAPVVVQIETSTGVYQGIIINASDVYIGKSFKGEDLKIIIECQEYCG